MPSTVYGVHRLRNGDPHEPEGAPEGPLAHAPDGFHKGASDMCTHRCAVRGQMTAIALRESQLEINADLIGIMKRVPELLGEGRGRETSCEAEQN